MRGVETRIGFFGWRPGHGGQILLTAISVVLVSVVLRAPAVAAEPDATPAWVWSQQEVEPDQEIFLRREFNVPGRAVEATLVGTADDEMQVFINGKSILQHGNWSAPVRVDIRSHLKPGRNVITARVKNHQGDKGGFLAEVNVEPRGKSRISLVTDDTWRVASRPMPGWHKRGFDDSGWEKARVLGPLGSAPWTTVNAETLAAVSAPREPEPTAVDSMKVAKDFQVELVYSVPKEEQGSWVAMCVDPQGRLIVSDQYGKLYRVTPAALGQADSETTIEPIPIDIGEAQGLLWAFDSLYVVVNTGGNYESGVYRAFDTDGDDMLDEVKQIKALDGGREHGPHAVLLTEDKKGLYIVAGNATKLPEVHSSRVPLIWDEDQLLPRTYGRGFMKGTPAPGGWICRIDPEATHWELVAVGFRNEYDAALNRYGDLFSYDADMEWDMNTPWYRPTRVCHVLSGAEFGWRNGAGKWPPYYEDNVPPVAEVGPGSPTGIVFGYEARFPARYQEALFICDWSYGKLYAVHFEPAGSSYSGNLEEFITGTPLPLTDLVVNPVDGALYFAIGGRKTKSALYRVTYQGAESVEPANPTVPAQIREARETRRRLSAFHGRQDREAIAAAWPYLGHGDRFLRYVARVAVEHQPLEWWQDKALSEDSSTQAQLTALLALVRVAGYTKPTASGPELDPPPPTYPAAPSKDTSRKQLKQKVLDRLANLEWTELPADQQLDLLRVTALTFIRMGPPDEPTRRKLIERFSRHFPTNTWQLNVELAELLVYLQAPYATEQLVELLENAPTQEEQIDYAKSLRFQRVGWTLPLRQKYFRWFNRARNYRGGASFSLFVQHIREDAMATLSAEEKEALQPILEAPVEEQQPLIAENREFVHEWKMEELVNDVANLKGRDFQHGRTMFAAAKCFACHRFDNQGGAIGPDLTALSGRFSPRDLLESIIEPSKVVSDQYEAVSIITSDGKVINGRIVNLVGDEYRINTNMLDPDALETVKRQDIDVMQPSKTSMMPEGLLNTLDKEEIMDLMAYLLSRGDPNHPAFTKKGAE